MGNSQSRPIRSSRSWTFSESPRRRKDSINQDPRREQHGYYTTGTTTPMFRRQMSSSSTQTISTLNSPTMSKVNSADGRHSSSTDGSQSVSPPCSPRLMGRPRAQTAGSRLRRMFTFSTRRCIEGSDGETIDLSQIRYQVRDDDKEIDQ
jgi:hypothetical protein